MIRYDVLWNNLVRNIEDMRTGYIFTAMKLQESNAPKDVIDRNRDASEIMQSILKKTRREFDRMKELDEEAQHDAVIIMTDLLDELRKLNKGKEEENAAEGLQENVDGRADEAEEDQ